MFLDPHDYPFTALLEEHWRSIREELEQLHHQKFIAWPEKFLYGNGWDVFGLYAFGNKLVENCRLCPVTTAVVEQIPGLTTAGFSSLQPGTHIEAHRGYTNAVLRCHLGLLVPDGATMRVGDQTRAWEEGRTLVFDDTIEHEVWHRGTRPRIILLLDFKRDADAHVALPETVRSTVTNAIEAGAS